MLSEKIANEIMAEIQEMVKDFVSDTIADRRSVSFDQIETRVSELKERFGKRLSEGALEAIGSGHIGQRIACQCGGTLEYQSNRRWILISLNGKLEIYRAYYYCEECKSRDRICNTWTITEKSSPKGRVKVVLINEALGL